MTSRYRYDADLGEAVPAESAEERDERLKREAKEEADRAWRAEEEKRTQNKGGYL